MKEILRRNQQHKILGGVCAGLADYLGIDVALIRIIFLLAFVAGCLGGLIYIILWIALPKNNSIEPSYSQTENKFDATIYQEKKQKRGSARIIFGFFLVIAGTLFLLEQFNLIPLWVDLDKLWPIFLIVAGFILIFNSSGNDFTKTPDTSKDVDQSNE